MRHETIAGVRNRRERVYVFVLQVILKRLAPSAPDGHKPQTEFPMKKSNLRPSKGRPKLPADERKSIMVPVKFDIDQYQVMMDKALMAGLNRSEYIRQSALHCKVVERLTPRDVKAIRDLQGIAENLNRTAKFVGAILNGGASEEQIVRTYREIIECKDFVLSLIKIYRNTSDSV